MNSSRTRLAYLSLTSKNERLLCGSLARLLHEMHEDEPAIQIRREWGRRQCDLAVLRYGEPMALIEAKAAMSFRLGGARKTIFSIPQVQSDINKLREIEFEGGRYALLFVTHNHQVPNPEYDPAMPYADTRRRCGVIDEKSIEKGFERFHGASEVVGFV